MGVIGVSIGFRCLKMCTIKVTGMFGLGEKCSGWYWCSLNTKEAMNMAKVFCGKSSVKVMYKK